MGRKKDTIRQLRKLVQRASRENPHLTSHLERAAFTGKSPVPGLHFVAANPPSVRSSEEKA